MKHKFIAKLPKDAKYIGKDFLNREHYRKGNYEYIILGWNNIERFIVL